MLIFSTTTTTLTIPNVFAQVGVGRVESTQTLPLGRERGCFPDSAQEKAIQKRNDATATC